MKNYLIVGCGFFGAVIANELSKISSNTITIIDKRDHIGGNCYTKKINDINVHVYGPHIFKTNSEKIWNYINNKRKTSSPPSRYIVAGHSLGGGLTYLTSADVTSNGLRDLFKFFPIAGPYSGNQDFVNYIIQRRLYSIFNIYIKFCLFSM